VQHRQTLKEVWRGGWPRAAPLTPLYRISVNVTEPLGGTWGSLWNRRSGRRGFRAGLHDQFVPANHAAPLRFL
jgi:hypothetical protein